MNKKANYTENELEHLRKKAKIRLRIVFTVTWIFFLFMLLFTIIIYWFESRYTWRSQRSIPETIFLSIVIPVSFTVPAAIILYTFIADRACDRFQYAYKDSLVLKTIISLELYEALAYDKKAGISFQDVYDAAVLDSGVKWLYISKDKLTGRYKGIPFEFANVCTRKLQKYGSTMRVETIFNGQVIRYAAFDSRKTCQGYLQIFHKNFCSHHKGRIAKYKILTEDVAFNEKYDIYASDSHNAYYILTPRLMEKIEEFSKQAEAQIAVSFYGTTLAIAVNKKFKVFNPKLDIPVAEQKQTIPDEIKILQFAGDILLCR